MGHVFICNNKKINHDMYRERRNILREKYSILFEFNWNHSKT
jgi:hypothetical protein